MSGAFASGSQPVICHPAAGVISEIALVEPHCVRESACDMRVRDSDERTICRVPDEPDSAGRSQVQWPSRQVADQSFAEDPSASRSIVRWRTML